MYEDIRVKYLFVDLKYAAYIKLQGALVIGFLIASALFYQFARGSESGLWSNGWWLCLVLGALEAVEARMAIGKAKKGHRLPSPTSR